MADSRHFENRYIAISVKNHPILMKFCTQQQILNWMNVIKNEKVALDRLQVRQNVFLVFFKWPTGTLPASRQGRCSVYPRRLEMESH